MSQGRTRRPGRLSSPTTWLAAAIALCIAGVIALTGSPAQARAATVNAQLSLSGLATKANVLGGSKIGVHPGDTVDFKASPLPTAGLENVPALGGLLSGVLSGLTASTFQVVVTFSSSFPGGARTVKLGGPTSGACAGRKDLPITFPTKGTYGFTWTVKNVAPGLLGGCSATGLNSTALNQLKQAGVALNASNEWIGTIQVAKNATDGGISVQLPGVGATPSVTGIGKLPGVSLKPVNVPTVPISVPSITSKVGGAVKSIVNRVTGGAKSTSPAKNGGSSLNVKYTPPPLTVPQKVMPHAVAVGGGGGSTGGFTAPGGGGTRGPLVAPPVTSTAAAAGSSSAISTPSAKPAGKTVDLADPNKLGGKQLPALLAIAAILALSLVTAAYARLVLLRRKPSA